MKKRGFTVRIGPLAMSLAAAAVTAVAFAAVSLADNGSDSSEGAKDSVTFTAPAPPGAGGGALFRDNLSDTDRQKLEDFRSCMEENGAPGPPGPGEIDPSNPPKPPSAADREKLEKAFEACKDNLPEDMQKMGPPQLHTCGPGGPPPGIPREEGNQQNQ
jgi:hypothetical protein